jgi:hypothetical protein
MTIWTQPGFLRRVLLVDAATCVATGAVMTVGSNLVAGLTQIPAGLLMSAGLSLFPIAAFIAIVAMRPATWPLGVWLIVLGNVVWVAGSLGLLLADSIAPNGLGYAFLIVQAMAVAVLAELEVMGVRTSASRA